MMILGTGILLLYMTVGGEYITRFHGVDVASIDINQHSAKVAKVVAEEVKVVGEEAKVVGETAVTQACLNLGLTLEAAWSMSTSVMTALPKPL